ncbi:capsular polysaccharide biosynthesis protein CapF [Geothrix sp. 21YS21S-4]|uniref:capsular polysaccharide biosynthesis protein CapF n=1 Tax=Geothrix sp. 21YS21S-4 TaxID=3068889 RepID=UPI0027BA108C|nr:capsular polysaccharide biosynthesis protein CapF [Geothrix sp. 21YS21S-4]
MATVVVTGAQGFLGRNLIATLSAVPDLEILSFDRGDDPETLPELAARADFVFHLAGVNRPQDPAEFIEGNVDVTRRLLEALRAAGRPVPVLISSSTQAALDNPYGVSKRQAEELVRAYGQETGAPVFVFRLPNVFGKWSRPAYNSVVATFCHRVAHGLPLEVHDPAREVSLVHVDDVVAEFIAAFRGSPQRGPDGEPTVPRVFTVTLGDLAERISRFPETRRTRETPDVGDDLSRRLYSMYLSYLPEDQFAYSLEIRRDPRGWLAEVLRSPALGQIFVSVTHPGIARGHHWHHTKTEKFLVVSGEAVVRFRPLDGREVIEYPVSGAEPRVVDIPPGYTHSITNTGATDLVTLFWASEPFDPGRPDTHALPV